MPRPPATTPTDTELRILRVLWDRGPCTVRQVHESLSAKRGTGYTTTLKMLQIMADKKLVARDESQRSHVYHARLSEERAHRILVRHMLSGAFDGSTQKLVMHALSAKKVSAAELKQIRRLLDELEAKGQ